MDKKSDQSNGFGITSFVLSLVGWFGITSFVLSLVGFFGFFKLYLAIFFSIAAIVFASLQKKNNSTGLATAGLVLGILGVIGNLIWLIFLYSVITWTM
jgi:hypothetical protein